jgi:hypothetical protein
VGRFADRTIVTLHAAAPGEGPEDRALTALLPNGEYLRARAALPVGLGAYAAVVSHFDEWAHASEAERMRAGRAEAERAHAIAVALGGTERLLRVHRAM